MTQPRRLRIIPAFCKGESTTTGLSCALPSVLRLPEMPESDDLHHDCPVHGVAMVPSGEYEPGVLGQQGSAMYPVLKCPEPDCTETWTAAPLG